MWHLLNRIYTRVCSVLLTCLLCHLRRRRKSVYVYRTKTRKCSCKMSSLLQTYVSVALLSFFYTIFLELPCIFHRSFYHQLAQCRTLNDKSRILLGTIRMMLLRRPIMKWESTRDKTIRRSAGFDDSHRGLTYFFFASCDLPFPSKI